MSPLLGNLQIVFCFLNNQFKFFLSFKDAQSPTLILSLNITLTFPILFPSLSCTVDFNDVFQILSFCTCYFFYIEFSCPNIQTVILYIQEVFHDCAPTYGSNLSNIWKPKSVFLCFITFCVIYDQTLSPVLYFSERFFLPQST